MYIDNFQNYQPKQSFYIINQILRLLITIQIVLVFFRVLVRNQQAFFLSDCLNACMMMLTYCQKNYCLALVTMFYIFSQIYLNAIFFLQFVEYKISFFIDVNKSFTLMLIFSTLLYVIESIMLYQVYKEYKGIIYDINQAYLENISQEQQNLEVEIQSSFQEQQSQQFINNQQFSAEQHIENSFIQESNREALSIQGRINYQSQEIHQLRQ